MVGFREKSSHRSDNGKQTLCKALMAFGSLLRALGQLLVNERLTTCSWVYIILIWPLFSGAPHCNVHFALAQDSYLRTRIFIKTGNWNYMPRGRHRG